MPGKRHETGLAMLGAGLRGLRGQKRGRLSGLCQEVANRFIGRGSGTGSAFKASVLWLVCCDGAATDRCMTCPDTNWPKGTLTSG